MTTSNHQPPKRPQKYLAGSYLRTRTPQLPPGVKPMPSPVKHIVAPHPHQAEIDACLQEIAEENRATIAAPIAVPSPVPESLLDFAHPLLHFDPSHVLRFEDLHPDIQKMCATLQHFPVKAKRGRPLHGDAPKSVAQRVAESRARREHEDREIRQMQLRADASEKFWREERAAGRLTLEHMQDLIDGLEAKVEQAAYEWGIERQRQRWTNNPSVFNAGNGKYDGTDNGGYGRFMADAPQGVGLLVTGGYNTKKITEVTAAHENAEKGWRRGRPEGAGPDDVEADD